MLVIDCINCGRIEIGSDIEFIGRVGDFGMIEELIGSLDLLFLIFDSLVEVII